MSDSKIENISRRNTLKVAMLGGVASVFGSLGILGGGFFSSAAAAAGSSFAPPPGGSAGRASGWNDHEKILANIKAPVFPDKDFPITDHGAVAGKETEVTAAIAKAIEACSKAGGGRVVVPAGEFVTGPIVLKSNVNLHLAEGATLRFVIDPAKYPLVFTRWEGIECMNFSPLIYAFEQENIAVTGKGTLDGQAAKENWWSWKLSHWDGADTVKSEDAQRPDARSLIAMGEKGVPVEERIFGLGHKLRPNFFQPYRCRNILVEGVTFVRSPMWEIHPVLSQNITVRNVTVSSHGPNNDGCNPESSKDVLIEHCTFDTGDDCIAIKSGKNNDGRRVNVATENVTIRNCVMKDGHGGVVLGSECSGHIRNIFVENCKMSSPNLERMLRFKNNAVRGGILEDIFIRNVEVGKVGEAIITLDLMYEEGAKGPHKPIVRNVQLDNIVAEETPRVMFVIDFPGAIIDDIIFTNCHFKGATQPEVMAVSGKVQFNNVVIEPKEKPKSLSTRSGAM